MGFILMRLEFNETVRRVNLVLQKHCRFMIFISMVVNQCDCLRDQPYNCRLIVDP